MLKLYIVFSQAAYGDNDENCAGLVLAHSHREARVVGWRTFADEVTDKYIDMGAQLLRDSEYLRLEADPAKLAADIPHGFYPASCERCECWGMGPIGEDGLCPGCRADKALECPVCGYLAKYPVCTKCGTPIAIAGVDIAAAGQDVSVLYSPDGTIEKWAGLNAKKE